MPRTDLKFGSKEWKTHMRRSLAQRKRHGEKINDIEGLISYIGAKGPAKKGSGKNVKAKSVVKRSKGQAESKRVLGSPKILNDLFPSPRVLRK